MTSPAYTNANYVSNDCLQVLFIYGYHIFIGKIYFLFCNSLKKMNTYKAFKYQVLLILVYAPPWGLNTLVK